MNELKIFNNPEFGQVRTIVEDGKILFCASDVAKALGYAKPANAVSQFCPHALKKGIGVETGIKADGTPAIQNVQINFIPEGDVYRLVVRSKLPLAEKFAGWVFDDVIPSIRKNGMYMTASVAEQAINNPTEFLARAVLLANQELDKLKTENQIMKPKAEYFDELVDRNTLTNFRETAKLLHLGQKKFIDWLLSKKFVYRNAKNKLQPYAQFVAGDSNTKGYFELKEKKGLNTTWSGTQTFITPRGREAFRLLLSQKLIAG